MYNGRINVSCQFSCVIFWFFSHNKRQILLYAHRLYKIINKCGEPDSELAENWGDDSVVKSVGSFSRGPCFNNSTHVAAEIV